MKTQFKANIYWATLYQVGVAFVLLWASRFPFYWLNSGAVGDMSAGQLLRAALWGVPFDLLAVAYVNSLFLLMRFMPARWAVKPTYLKITDWIYYVTNSLMLFIQLVDMVYFTFVGSRMTWSAVTVLAGEQGIGTVVFSYIVPYWWAVLGIALVIGLMVWLYHRVRITGGVSGRTRVATALKRTAILIAMLAGLGAAMRGSLGPGYPLSIPDAVRYVDNPAQSAVVLNTPFTLLRSLNIKDMRLKEYEFFTAQELERHRRSEHPGIGVAMRTKPNVVMIVMETGASEWIESLNPTGNGPKGLMPYVDSLSRHSLVVPHCFTTGVLSKEGLANALGGFPNLHPFNFALSPYSTQAVDALPALLKRQGYATAFYCGCEKGSQQLDVLALTLGCDRVVNRNVYGLGDFDGSWGVWDHKMAERAVNELSHFSEPFFATWMTISAHGPYPCPDDWCAEGYRSPAGTLERSVEYTDRSVRHFMRLASRQPWYDNTIFVIISDHGVREHISSADNAPYLYAHIPFIVYSPGGLVEPRRLSDDVVMAQYDIPTTLLSLIGYPDEYVSLGRDVLDSSEGDNYALSLLYDQLRIIGPRYVVEWNPATDAVGHVFDIRTDKAMRAPLKKPDDPAEVQRMVDYARAMLQDLGYRMNHNLMSSQP